MSEDEIPMSPGGSFDEDYKETPVDKFLTYAGQGDTGGVKRAMASGVDINAKDPRTGECALSMAAKAGHVALVNYLLERKADPNSRDVNGVTPVMKASFRGYPNIVRALIAAGGDANVRGNKGQTALLAAVQAGHLNVIEMLIKLAPNMDFNVRDKNGHTALMICSTNGRRDILKRLVEAGADPNFVNQPTGETPFLVAARRGDSEMLKFLASLGADVDARDAEGRTPLFIAVDRNAMDLVETLIDAKADVNARAYNGMTALAVAAKTNNIQMVERLLKAGAEDSEDETGLSAEKVASDRGHRTVLGLIKRWKVGENKDPFSPTTMAAQAKAAEADALFAKAAGNGTPSTTSSVRYGSYGNGASPLAPEQPVSTQLLNKASDIKGLVKRTRMGADVEAGTLEKLAEELKAIVADLEANELNKVTAE